MKKYEIDDAEDSSSSSSVKPPMAMPISSGRWEQKLHDAVTRQDESAIKHILDTNDDAREGISKRNWFPGIRQSPLHQAVYMGHESVLNLLLDRGGNVNSCVEFPGEPKNRFGLLHAAILTGKVEMVRLLLARGADISLEGTYSDFLVEEGRWIRFRGSAMAWARSGEPRGTPESGRIIIAMLESHAVKHGLSVEGSQTCILL